MARKLKSDKVLFLATLLLVLASVVMVYSASAAMAEFRFGNPYLFLVKQGMWAALGIAIMAVIMRVDYRVWRQPALIWAALGFAALALVAVLFSAPINGTRRWFGIAGFGIQPSEVAKLAVIFFTAALLERRMNQVNDLRETLVPLGIVIGVMTGLILLEPDFGTSACLVATAGLMLFSAGLSLRYVAVAAGTGAAGGRGADRDLSVPPEADPLVHVARGGPARRGVPAAAVADRRRQRRRVGPRADGRPAEAVLPAGTAHRLHLRRDRRGARPDRRHAHAGRLCRDHAGAASASPAARPTASARSWPSA